MRHLKDNNETYINHFKFASKIGTTLIFRGVVFILHAFVPFYNVPRKWNLENIMKKTRDWDEYTKKRLEK